MKQETPYILERIGLATPLHVGNRSNKETGALILEPLDIEDAQILMQEDQGPRLFAGGQLWPVRTYRTAYNIDSLMYSDRFKTNVHALSLYSFERQAAEGHYMRAKEDSLQLESLPRGKPQCVDLKTLRALQNQVLVLPTERRNEFRLLKPFFEALAEIGGQVTRLGG